MLKPMSRSGLVIWGRPNFRTITRAGGTFAISDCGCHYASSEGAANRAGWRKRTSSVWVRRGRGRSRDCSGRL